MHIIQSFLSHEHLSVIIIFWDILQATSKMIAILLYNTDLLVNIYKYKNCQQY